MATHISPYFKQEDAIYRIIIGDGQRTSWEVEHDKGDKPTVEFFKQLENKVEQVNLKWEALTPTSVIVKPVLTLARDTTVVVKISK